VRSRKRALVLMGAAFVMLAACTGRPSGSYVPPSHDGSNSIDPHTIHTAGAVSKSVEYGPYNIPGKNQPAAGPFALVAPFLGGQAGTGMIWNKPVVNVTKPCTDCYITKITADMTTMDGQNANVSRGLWLHHMVLLVSGTGHTDATCASGLQQVAISRSGAERLFASGNERTPVPVGGIHGGYGYKVNTADQFHLIMDLMNENTAATAVRIKLNYEYLPGTTPGIKNVKPLWFDANQCGVSEVPAQTGKYSIASGNWSSTVRGTLLGGGGHLHDGGTHLTIEKNSQVICDSVARYGTDPAFSGGGMDHGGGGMDGMDHGGMQSISDQTICPDMGTINTGDRMHITGYYDDAMHEQMMHGGKLHNIMAIALVYVGQ
jgi:hypothetical protein